MSDSSGSVGFTVKAKFISGSTTGNNDHQKGDREQHQSQHQLPLEQAPDGRAIPVGEVFKAWGGVI